MSYSDQCKIKFLNINGRVCLRNSLMFTALVALVIYVLQPFVVDNFVNSIIEIKPLKWSLFTSIFIIFVVDFIISTTKHVKLATIITKLSEFKDFTLDELDKAKEYIKNTKAYDKLAKLSARYPSFKIRLNGARVSIGDLVSKVKEKVGFKK